MSRRRVFVTGLGAITPLGRTWPESVQELKAGKSAVRRLDAVDALDAIHAFDVSGFPCQVAARIEAVFEHTEDRRLALAQEALRQAWKPPGVPGERIGVFMGAESGRASLATILGMARAAGGGQRFDHGAFGKQGGELARHIDASVVSPATVASALARAIGARGPATTISVACSSASAAIAEAVRAIRLGECDAALAGGVGADVDPIMLVGFGKLGALSARGASCPFDVHRDGFVVGEGAAMVTLSCEPQGMDIEITGTGRSLDAYHLTAPDPQGEGAVRAMRAALADARRDHVDYVQAHGTSTPLNDAIEARALHRVFGPAAARMAVSSVKGAVGHWVAGAGAIGLLCAIEAVRSGVVLPTAGLTQPDPECALGHVMGQAIHRRVDAALVNAFAFGGANTSIVVERTRP